MNLILFLQQQERYHLAPNDPRRRHLVQVVGVKVGSEVYLGAANGPRALATVTEDDPTTGMTLKPRWEAHSPLPAPLELWVGLPRPQTARRVLFEAACQGARRLVFFQSARGEPSYRDSRLWQTAEWQRHLWEGAEQAFSTVIPQVAHYPSLDTALADEETATAQVALDVYEGTCRLSVWASRTTGPWRLALGAERGWETWERHSLCEAGFTLASLGERVLKVETALTAGVTLLRACSGEC
ncbi:MAG: RsmE family RNA methyltransferase [Opitutales bacterium]